MPFAIRLHPATVSQPGRHSLGKRSMHKTTLPFHRCGHCSCYLFVCVVVVVAVFIFTVKNEMNHKKKEEGEKKL